MQFLFTTPNIIMMPLGGGILPYMGYIGMCSVWFFSHFGHKLGIDFSHFATILVFFNLIILLEEATSSSSPSSLIRALALPLLCLG